MLVHWLSRWYFGVRYQWRSGRTAGAYQSFLNDIDRGIKRELEITKRTVAGLQRLKRDFSKAMAEYPWAADLLCATLIERMEGLRKAVSVDGEFGSGGEAGVGELAEERSGGGQ